MTAGGNDRLRLAVFDCDGTLVDSQHTIIAAMNAAYAAHDLAQPEAGEVRRMVGLSLSETFQRLLPDAGADIHERLRTSYGEAFGAMRRDGRIHEPLFPGAEGGLGDLADAGWILGVATGKSHRGLVATLERHGLLGRFATLQTADVAAGKPDPDMLFKAMAETGAEPGSTVMVGDTTYDMEMARNAGTMAIGVAWGYHEAGELRASGAEVVVDAFADLPAAVATLLEACR